jgi:hypothetical protein
MPSGTRPTSEPAAGGHVTREAVGRGPGLAEFGDDEAVADIEFGQGQQRGAKDQQVTVAIALQLRVFQRGAEGLAEL